MMAMEGDSLKLWMNIAWTQKTFRDVEKDPSLLIIEYCVKDIGSKGDNYMSDTQWISIRLQYHATSVALHDRDPQLISSFKESIMTEESSKHFVQNFVNPSIISIAKSVWLWPGGGEKMANKLLNVAETFCQHVEDVRLVDFQQVVYSSCVIDLQHFIITSPSEEVRVAHTENILKEYHKELCLTLQLLVKAKKAISSQ
ncbi:hypothetical protein PR048_000837 [Dryococelus australis]|uniref:CHK kinase-like domain-containing protein n=1 Tax=Dryococelus australis TaxID=614101 RepID=A0ABQ9IFP5_9NEOP|nr:hypothetical protein PR048_000837 [Dryococelus australis]